MEPAASDLPPYADRPPTLVGVGGVAWSGDPHAVYSTLLGSCIAVCLWDAEAKKGGMVHVLLPDAPSPLSDDTRYAEIALPLLLRSLVAAGCRQDRLRAVIAGGADVLVNMKKIGTENTEFALRWLRTGGLPIVRKDVGGTMARRVRFVPSTGEIDVTRINARDPKPAS